MASIARSRIAVLLPCYNEEAAIARDGRRLPRGAARRGHLRLRQQQPRPHAARSRAQAGAVVRSERQQGKGHVVRRMFADVDADVYVMADGDLTYDPKAAPAMVDMLLADQLDMVVGTRKHEAKRCLSRRSRAREPHLHRAAVGPVRAQLQRHLFRLPGVLAPLREELSGAVVGLRDRNRDERSRARAADAGRRGRDSLCARGPKARNPSFRPVATAGGS